MSLMMNSIDAMKDVDGTRELAIKSHRTGNEQLMVCVSDSGAGLPSQQADQIFHAFFTTKPHGIGMGLAICRSIVESLGIGWPARSGTDSYILRRGAKSESKTEVPPSGVGKSSLLRVLGGLQQPTDGTVRRNNTSVHGIRRRVASRFRIRAFSPGSLWKTMLPSDLIFKQRRYFMTSKLNHACSGSR
jgi:Histidine kinase-, DNA gyrase B-, and HSP90-like ATPase/ABC transporter